MTVLLGIVSDTPGADPSATPEALRKENARLARRVSQLESTLQQIEAIRDTNARLLDRMRGELEVERTKSHDPAPEHPPPADHRPAQCRRAA